MDKMSDEMPDKIHEKNQVEMEDSAAFNAYLKMILPEDQLRHVVQVEKILSLAGAAERSREIERYQAMETDLEELEQSGGELHGFLKGACMLMEAHAGGDAEPFRDEFIIRQFTSMPQQVQRQLVQEFWSEDPEVAALLEQILELSQTEVAALILWLDRAERSSAVAESL